MDKYKLIEAANPPLPGMKRIRALRDIPVAGVKAGDVGGWVKGPENLSQSGDCWVLGEAMVSGNARVSDNAVVFGRARVHGEAMVSGNARVFGDAWVWGYAQVYGSAWVYGKAAVSDNAVAFGRARVSGCAAVSGSAQVYDRAQVCGMASVYGEAAVFGDAQVCGGAVVTEGMPVLTVASVLADGSSATMFWTPQGPCVAIGPWTGLLDEVDATGSRMPWCDLADVPVLRAFADMCRAHAAARWPSCTSTQP